MEDTRNHRDNSTDREVKKNIVSNHPLLYYNGYKTLYNYSQTKSYKIGELINNIHKRLKKTISKNGIR